MSQIKSFVLLLCAFVAPLFVGCEPVETTVPEEAPVMVLDIYELLVDGGGGEIPIFYAVENARNGVDPEVSSNVDWVSVISVGRGVIMLNVAPSDIDEERFGFVTITYKGMEKALKVPVVQDKQLLDKFSFEVLDITHSSCSIKYTPKVSGKLFMANIIDSAFFTQSGISDMNLFIEAEMANYLNIAQQYDMTLEFLLKEALGTPVLYTEEVTRSFANMQPGATYVAYAYGVDIKDNEYTVTIPFHSVVVDTPMSQFYDVTFNISPQVSAGGVVTIAITPLRWSGYYVVSLIPDSSLYYVPSGERMTEYTLRAIGSDFYKRARQAMQSGMSAEAYLKSSCYMGSRSITTAISGGSKYMVVVYAVESIDGDIPVMCSIPTIAYI